MLQYFIFIIIGTTILITARITRQKGFDGLTVERKLDRNRAIEGETFRVTTTIENKKRLPISFLIINEKIPINIEYEEKKNLRKNPIGFETYSIYSIGSYERVKRTYKLKALKRGVYGIKDMEVNLGDIFGLASESKVLEDYLEIIVYPKIQNIKQMNFHSNSIHGNDIVKRWIYKDPLYIKGIREYTVEDRMKDIHWKSSLKMNKFMVKDYDYTSDMEIMLIVNVQCTEPYWCLADNEGVERCIRTTVSLAQQIIKEGVPVGMMTNALLMGYEENFIKEVNPSMNSFNKILELSARIDYSPKERFSEFLRNISTSLNKNCIYVIVATFIDEESLNIMARLSKLGFLLKVVDTSKNSTISKVSGIEKVVLKEEAVQ